MSESAQVFFESLRTAGDVTGLLGRAEDLYFEAKTCSDPFPEPDQRHLAEALSGFANADGGVLVYGLVAAGGDRTTSDVVKRVEPIKSLKLLNSRLLALVGQLVEPPVAYVRVELREFDRQPHEGFVLVYVPPSDLGPHRSRKDREYYRRHGYGFYRMEHFEIAEMFGRRRRPSLSLTWSLPASSPAGTIFLMSRRECSYRAA
jgi:predicted HTH transcriptional regulator